ncbi:TetR/AcrR family transcriptional regulator [Sphaerisporangium sp. TRM90804]|uniref:TetR/AcrR family transcriptional regulator n=1 Tax=Sphaerisporangium sp. TRM90804 TaxID=3031113 RepID=UPI00244AD443|nr:TetR/AcrR family transcriptional regulator [Sphaerisporangium sp. TRM90804]MDH2426071.1 TetR/AcrR family transcriptional regulator [Sphaerisporangium sp. TRM90804]
MSPKTADPAVRARLIESAARVLAEEGPNSLTARRLAAEAGTSTTAVYTFFGGMDQVWHAVRREGFARLATHLDATPDLADPVANLVAGGAAYLANGMANPNLYRAMFDRHDVPDIGNDTFGRLVGAVRRCVDAGRFHRVEPLRSLGWAVQSWTMRHGMVSLAIAELMPAEHVPLHFADMSRCLFIGYGDDPEAAERSVDLAMREWRPVDPAGAS